MAESKKAASGITAKTTPVYTVSLVEGNGYYGFTAAMPASHAIETIKYLSTLPGANQKNIWIDQNLPKATKAEMIEFGEKSFKSVSITNFGSKVQRGKASQEVHFLKLEKDTKILFWSSNKQVFYNPKFISASVSAPSTISGYLQSAVATHKAAPVNPEYARKAGFHHVSSAQIERARKQLPPLQLPVNSREDLSLAKTPSPTYDVLLSDETQAKTTSLR